MASLVWYDSRFAVGSLAVEDLAEDAHVRHIVTPTPLAVDEGSCSGRAKLQRAFQVCTHPLVCTLSILRLQQHWLELSVTTQVMHDINLRCDSRSSNPAGVADACGAALHGSAAGA